jgi:hypothetical protein
MNKRDYLAEIGTSGILRSLLGISVLEHLWNITMRNILKLYCILEDAIHVLAHKN